MNKLSRLRFEVGLRFGLFCCVWVPVLEVLARLVLLWGMEASESHSLLESLKSLFTSSSNGVKLPVPLAKAMKKK